MRSNLIKRISLWTVVVIVTLLLIAFIGAGLFLSQGKLLSERHEPFPFDQEFDFSNASFADYVVYSRRLIQAARLDNPSQDVIDNLAPFELTPPSSCPRNSQGQYARGIVLTHGLIDSPYSMLPIGEYFQSQCFYVLGLLIPDHGTRPGNFLDTRWEQWAEAQHFATEQLAARAEQVFLSGHSAGGTLAILEAVQNSAVDGLIVFAPALSITPAAKYAGAVSLIGKVFPKAAWFEVEPDEAIYRYESFPFNAAAETYGLIKATEQAVSVSPLQIPIFTVASMQDNTVGTQAILEFMESVQHPASQTLLYSQHPYPDSVRLQVRISSYPESGILSVSHLGLMTPSTHPYFGQNGEYRNCGHYGSPADELFVRCKNGERDFYAEATGENLAQGLVERIAFNPDYEGMLEDIEEFLANLNSN